MADTPLIRDWIGGLGSMPRIPSPAPPFGGMGTAAGEPPPILGGRCLPACFVPAIRGLGVYEA
jgi:hypothetical protein